MDKKDAIAQLLNDAVKASEDGNITFSERLILAKDVVQLLMAILIK